MTDNEKMTDNDIKKVLECCINDDCDNCPNTFGNCEHNAMRNAFDLINRKDAEIERLKKEIKDRERAYNDEFCSRKEWQSKCQELIKEKQIIRSEAIKEFAERLKETITNAINTYYNSNGGGYYLAEDVIEDIDNLKEIMEELK